MKSLKSVLFTLPLIILFFLSSVRLYAQEFVVYDATRDFTESDKGFLNFQFKSSSPPNWLSPKNYFDGEWYFRYEVIGIPTSTTYKLSTCIWSDWNWPTSWNETCHDATPALNGKGVYFHTSSPSDWWKKDGVGVNFAKPYNIKELGIVLWGVNGGGNCNVTPYIVANGCNYLAPKLTPMKIRVTIVAVAAGQTFSGWSNYGLSGGTPSPPPSGTAPSITKHPSSVTVNEGQKASFSVSASGTSPLSYQWRRNGSNISGANSSLYTTPNLSLGNNGDSYTCRISNSKGAVTSNQARVTVNSNASPAPPPSSGGGSTIRIEIENGYSKVTDVGSNGNIGVQSSTINSNGKAVSIPDKGDKISVPFSISKTGTYKIRVWLRSGNATNRTSYFNSGYSYKFSISGIGNVNFVGNAGSVKGPYSAFGGSHWGFMETTVNITSTGTKSLVITADYVWQAVDYVEIIGDGASSGGSTPAPPPSSGGGSTTRIEIENGYSKVTDVGSNGNIGVQSSTINSNGKAVSIPDKGDKISVPFSISKTGTYKIRVWLRSGNATNRTSYFNSGYSYKFSISGIGNVNFVGNAGSVKGPYSAFGGSHWGFMETTVNITSTGTKSLVITADYVWQAVDYVEIIGDGASSGGSTPAPPPSTGGGSTTRIEAENAYSKVTDIGSNGTIGVRSFSINSNGKAVSVPDKGDKIRIAFKINQTGTYKIRVWLRSGNATSKTSYFNSGFSYKFSVSGIGNVNFAGNAASVKGPYSAWGGSHWGLMEATVNFTSTGTKYLEIGTQHVWQAVDYIEIEGESSSAARVADNSDIDSEVLEANSIRQNMIVYPNPIGQDKIVQILLAERSSEPIETKLYSLHGALLKQKEVILGVNENSFELDLSNVINKNGFYILRVSQGNNETKTIKLVYR